MDVYRHDAQMQETAEADRGLIAGLFCISKLGLAADSNRKQVVQLRVLQRVEQAMVSSMFQQI